MAPSIRICSISAYATVGSRLNLSALSILLKELYRIDNSFDNTRVRRKHDSIEALTSSKTFFNSLSFPLSFRTNDRAHNLHVRIFTTGTLHITGASDYEVTIKRAFLLIFGLVSACHMKEESLDVVQNVSTFCLKNMRVAMIHSIYHHTRSIDREKTASELQRIGRNVRYDPKLHNAINSRFTDNNGTFLIFKSGKILVTGCKNMDTCTKELEALIHSLI